MEVRAAIAVEGVGAPSQAEPNELCLEFDGATRDGSEPADVRRRLRGGRHLFERRHDRGGATPVHEPLTCGEEHVVGRQQWRRSS
jgi:hypothetical protein